MNTTPIDLRRSDLALGALVFSTAFLLRIVYLVQISEGPLFDHLIADSAGFDAWAQRIVGGDWFGTSSGDPGMSDQSAPVYPYFLALARQFVGGDYFLIRLLQMAVGSCSCVFVFLAGRAFFGRAAGVMAGFMLALYPPALYYDGLIQKGLLGGFFLCVMLWLVGSAQRAPSWGRWIAIGATFGMITLDRENALVLSGVLIAWLALRFRFLSFRSRLAGGVLIASGVALVLVPAGLRNLRATGTFALGGSNVGANFYIGNHSGADGAYVPLRPGHASPAYERRDAREIAEENAGRQLTPAQVSDYWLGRAWESIRGDPAGWLGLMGTKWLLVWNRLEIADAEDFYSQGQWSWVLSGLGTVLHFGVLAPLAAAGIVLSWPRRRDAWVLYAMILALAGSVALFFVMGRYRYPLVPLLIIFAGAFPVLCGDLWRDGRRQALIIAGAVLLASAIVCNWPLRSRERQMVTARMNLGVALSEMNRLDEASQVLEEVVAIAPTFSEAHNNLGNVWAKKRDYARAVTCYRNALRSAPDLAETHSNLADALRKLGQHDGAVEHYRRAAELRPRDAAPYFGIGLTLSRAGRNEDAAANYRRAVGLDPDFADAWYNLGNALNRIGQANEAADAYEQALKIDPQNAAARYNLASTLVVRERRQRAIEVLRVGVRIHPGDLEMRALLDSLIEQDQSRN